jgi:hypothetical protein
VEARRRTDLEDLDDAGVLQLRDRAPLALESIDVRLVEGQPGAQDLERHGPPQLGVGRQVDDGHAAASDLALDLEAPESHTRPEDHGAGGRLAGIDDLETALEPGPRDGGHAVEKRLVMGLLARRDTIGVLTDDAVEQVVEAGVVFGVLGAHGMPSERAGAIRRSNR